MSSEDVQRIAAQYPNLTAKLGQAALEELIDLIKRVTRASDPANTIGTLEHQRRMQGR